MADVIISNENLEESVLDLLKYIRLNSEREVHMESSKVLQLFSGGKDSFLSTCKLLEEDNTVFLATFENGCGLCCENVRHGVDRLTEKYGKERVVFLGIYNISGIWREFLYLF